MREKHDSPNGFPSAHLERLEQGRDAGNPFFGKDSPFSPSSSKNTLIVGVGTLLSRLLGFVRDAGIAWLLGGSAAADALTAALRIPYMARRLFGEGTLSLSLTAACTRERLHGGSGCGLALAVTRRLALWGGLLALACLLAAEPVMRLTAPGLSSRPDTLAESATLFRLCAPYIWSILLASGCMAALHSRQRFLLPTLTPSLFNLCVIGFTLAAACTSGLPPATLIACGVLCGGLLQWLVQLPPAIRLRQDEVPAPASPELVTATLRRLPAGIAGAAMPQLAFLGASALASLLPEGHMASLFYAERLLEFPLGVLGAAVGMAAAPRLAELAAFEGLSASRPHRAAAHADPHPRPGSFTSEVRRAVLLSLGLNLPAAAGLAAIAAPLVAVVLGHGAFDAHAVAATAQALCAYAPGLPAYALSRPLLAACHALESGLPLKAAATGLAVSLAAGYLLTRHFGAWGPSLGVSLGLWCNAALLWAGLSRHVALRIPLRSILAQLAGTAIVFGTASLAMHLCFRASPLLQLALAVPAGAVGYGCTLLLFDRPLLRLLKRHGS